MKAKKKMTNYKLPTHGIGLAGKHSGAGKKAKAGNHGAGSADSHMKTIAEQKHSRKKSDGSHETWDETAWRMSTNVRDSKLADYISSHPLITLNADLPDTWGRIKDYLDRHPRVALNADLPDESNEQRRRIVLALHNLRGKVVNGMLALSRIVEEYNKDRPRHARLTGGRIGYVLNKELGLTTKRGMGNLTFLLWEDAKIKRLFISMVIGITHPPENGELRECDIDTGEWTQLRAETAVKHDNGKPRFDLIPPGPLEKITEVFNYGAEKYAPRNWELGMSWGRVFGAIQRHLWAFWGGEDEDKESGLLHLASAGWGIMALLEYTEKHKKFDDRPRKRRKYERRKPAGEALPRTGFCRPGTEEAGKSGLKSTGGKADRVSVQSWARTWGGVEHGFLGKSVTGAKSNETNQKHTRKDKKRQKNGAVSMPAV